ncbi:MAG TPA: MDR family oxidoreductase [Burkholderiaceae bacterium]|jgi:acrylyl-CoA reductase (NADPH)|nr:MDR family oxidoreductase [Burkholderiaceae bacterium]
MFKAIYLTKTNDQFSAAIRALDEAELEAATPDADVTLAVEYSTINYKDGLALTNKSPIVRTWPMVPGIDAAGTVIASKHPAWQNGDRVILNGWGAGETHWGGLAQKARFKGDWLVRVPDGMSTRQAMAIGTAGYTAMLCCLALADHGVKPGDGDILVTGATGGVGSIAVAILARRGYRVVASTGKLNETEYLQGLGAAAVIDRSELSAPGKPLQKERWAGVVDSVGSHTLANACAQTKAEGVVTACGLAQGMDFPATVAPFILRGVKLIGINSVYCPLPLRRRAWDALAAELDRAKLDSLTREVGLDGCFEVAREILAGKIRGRVVVNVNA